MILIDVSISSILDFLSLKDPNVRYVLFGTMLLGICAAVVGSFTYLRKRALVGDAIAHAVLPGVALAFMLTGNKNPLILIIGASITGWIALWLVDFISNNSRLKTDTVITLVLSTFFGFGVLLLSKIQGMPNASQAGLDSFIFGQAAAMTGSDVYYFVAISILVLLIVLLFYKEFKIIAFDRDFALANNINVRLYEFLLSLCTVLTVAVGIQAVGAILMAALLITPAAIGRLWSDKLSIMIVVAAFCGALAGAVGSYVSSVAPGMPTGPWIIVTVSVLVFLSILVAPKKGLISRARQKRDNGNKILRENILKTFYHLGEADGVYQGIRTREMINQRRPFKSKDLKIGLNWLRLQNLVDKEANGFQLTKKGLKESIRITRLHRLWELYLTEYLNLAEDHVHEDADAIEHIITPEIEEELMELFKGKADPHGKTIPREELI